MTPVLALRYTKQSWIPRKCPPLQALAYRRPAKLLATARRACLPTRGNKLLTSSH